jgi:hypothetical protein
VARILSGALLALMVWFILGPSQAQDSASGRKLEDLVMSRSQATRMLGIVRDGEFSVIHPEQFTKKDFRLTTIGASEARSPESSRLDLSRHEGGLIMVEGVDKGRWVYDAKIIDQASPIMITVISELFGGARIRRLR